MIDDQQLVDVQRKRKLRKAVGALIVTLGLTGWAFAYVSSRNLLGRETLWLLPMLLVGLWVSYSYWTAAHTGAPGPDPEEDIERRGGYRFTLAGLLIVATALGLCYGAASFISRRLSALEGVAVAEATVVSTGATISGRYSLPWAKIRFSLPNGRAVETYLSQMDGSIDANQKTIKIRYKIRDPRYAVRDSDPLVYLVAALWCAIGAVCLMMAYMVSRPLPSTVPGRQTDKPLGGLPVSPSQSSQTQSSKHSDRKLPGGQVQTKALRVAAYFLIAHYLTITVLALLGKEAPDFIRIAVTLGLLIGSVGSLFIPRKLGWVSVALYAWYAGNPFALATWAIWVSPAMQAMAKIIASLTLALINAPLIAALVLVFKPASFASFRNPVADDDAPARASGKPNAAGAAIDIAGVEQAPGTTSSIRQALGWSVAIAVLAVAALVAFDFNRTARAAQWLTSAQFQREFDTVAPRGFYPGEVEGQCQADGEKYRADWKVQPEGAPFFAYFGMTLQNYELKDKEYRSQGYTLESVKHFKDCSGIERYQATWLKR